MIEMKWFTVAALCLFATAGAMDAPTARAQNTSGNDYYSGQSSSTMPKCPTVEWHLLPMPFGTATNINGIAYYSDMSGISIVRGTSAADGTVIASLASVSGSGPVGTVTGTRTGGMTKVVLAGAGCANATIELRRWRSAGGGD